MENYNSILKVLKDNNIRNIEVDIVNCVDSSISKTVSEEEFEALCTFTKYIWDKAEKGYTQLIADIVVDLYQDCDYGYRNEEKEITKGYDDDKITFKQILTLEDLKECDYRKREMVLDIFYNKYYD